MEEFDTGSNWKEDDQLTAGETEKLKEILESQGKFASEFTFWMREHGAKPKAIEMKINSIVRGDAAAEWMWLFFHGVKAGWTTKEAMLHDILIEGIHAVYNREKQGVVAQAMQARLNMQFGELGQKIEVARVREAIAKREQIKKKAEEDALRAMEQQMKEPENGAE